MSTPESNLATDPRFIEGVALFNAGRYFEAHEVWEHVWRECPPTERRFVQSLIHAAVALYQWSRGNRLGAVTQVQRGQAKAAEYPPGHLGFDTRTLWADIGRRLDPMPHPDPPRISLTVSPHGRNDDDR